MFIDYATIHVEGGAGGRGCVAFRREKYVPRGGPSGGDGGGGGSVWVEATESMNTLQHLRYKREYKADRGQHGEGSNRSGRTGSDTVISLPVGSVVTDKVTGEIIADLVEPGQRVRVASGGRGGLGNQNFASATNQAPRYAQPGEAGETRDLIVELKLIADIGLVGLPNAGKSTLISVISAARPKIADYPFTTLEPVLGVVPWGDLESFVVADIPGLIEGAHEGHGLGDRFLRHVERCRMLVHMVDLSSEDPARDAAVITAEIRAYSDELARKPRIVCGTKLDAASEGSSEKLRKWAEDGGFDYREISAVTGAGVDQFVYLLGGLVKSEEKAVSR
ncbi:MAG: GTPase ObgE [Acidobacteria bacterium]|nr:GTPase ObgE [Acidobacteriota bacterium]